MFSGKTVDFLNSGIIAKPTFVEKNTEQNRLDKIVRE